MHINDADGMANSVDPDQTATEEAVSLSDPGLYPVFLDLSVPNVYICSAN